MRLIKTVKDAFEEAQFHTHQHEKVSELLQNLYLKPETEGPSFCNEFIHNLKYAMIESKPEPAVERLIKFASKYVARMGKSDDTADFFNEVIQFLLTSYDVNDKAVRYRSCQLLAQIVEFLGDAEIDDEICDRILESMHTRLSDKLPTIRVQAIKALSRLQDPADKRCPIIKAFLFLMSSDPNWQVRLECLRCIAPTKRSLLAMVERTRDVNEVIRRAAYNVISEKVSVKALSISQRLLLLENGLSDRSVLVRNTCRDKMLQAWLIHYQANILDLLSGLDVMSSGDICEKAVTILLSKAPVDQLIEGLDLLNEERLIDKDRLSCESAFYYQLLLSHISKQGDETTEYLDKILPDVKVFINYISKFMETSPSGENEAEERATNEYILQQLILCIHYLDISDPVSRKSVLGLCKELLNTDSISLSLTPELVNCLKFVLKTPAELITEMASIIADIQLPMVMEEQPIDPEHLHQLKYKLAGVNLNMNELSEQLSDAVSRQDFAAAAELKQKVEVLEVSKQALQEEMKPKPVPQPSQPRNDDTTKLKCLTIFVELMKSPNILSMTDTIRSYMEELVIPAIPDNCPAIRNQAIKALGLCSLCDQTIARKFLPIFLQICQLDSEAVRVSSLEALFDILLIHSTEFLKAKDDNEKASPENVADDEKDDDNIDDEKDDDNIDDEKDENGDHEYKDSYDTNGVSAESDEASDENSQGVTRSINGLITMMVGCLDDESSEVRSLCAEGLAKLLLSGQICSSKLISRLIILWYNPVTEDDVKLRHCLGVFFPVYAFSSRANQLQVEEAFIPTLQVLFDAPKTSPLSEIDECNVAELLVQLTDSCHVKHPDMTVVDLTCHDSLAVKICNEMIEKGNCYGLQTLSKSLTMLQLSVDNEMLAKDLKILTHQLLQMTDDKQVLKYIQKFESKVNEMKQHDTSHNDDDAVTRNQNGTDIDQVNELGDGDGDDDDDDNDADEDGDCVDSTVLDTTLATSKYKRTVANRKNSVKTTKPDQTSDSHHSDGSDKDIPLNKSRKITLPELDEDSD